MPLPAADRQSQLSTVSFNYVNDNKLLILILLPVIIIMMMIMIMVMLDDEEKKKKNVEGDNSNVEPNFILTVLQNKLLLF